MSEVKTRRRRWIRGGILPTRWTSTDIVTHERRTWSVWFWHIWRERIITAAEQRGASL